MEFSDLILKRYSCRDFDPVTIGDEIIKEILIEASNSPSAKNTQPWKVYISNSNEENDKIKRCLQDDNKNKFLDNASAFIVIYEEVPKDIECKKFTNDRFIDFDCGEFVAYLTLSAKSKGLDSCIIGWINQEKLLEVTNVDLRCLVVVAFGKGKYESNKIKKRKNLSEIIITR